ncbi:MAG: 1-deoxy-D-xylulose-5-phosphate reductoisomerase [Hyphomicrobiales bacterium]|jgi:1-deoxy-D-xylulose-5-phosphate reductoisomerase
MLQETLRGTPARQSHAEPRSVTILGATGSIGSSTVDLLKRQNGRFTVKALTAHKNGVALAKLARDLGANFAAVADHDAYRELKSELSGSGIEAASGSDSVAEAARRPAEWVVGAITGTAGLEPSLAAIERGATLALANKESLVCAGTLVMRRARETGATVLPVDSEHNALFQAMTAGRREDVTKVIITASGGPFRTWTKAQIEKATLAAALKHPNWSMGPKVTIDSATLMNKGLEIIEAYHLFNLKPDEIEVLVHPQSIVHGMVEFRDGSVLAHLGPHDMRVAIAHCLAYPDRIDGPVKRLDLAEVGSLTFEKPDLERFPALRLAWQAMRAGSGATTVLNAANEIAVAEFVAEKISFTGIPALVEATMDAASRRGIMREPDSIADALAVDHDSRNLARELLPEIASKAF